MLLGPASSSCQSLPSSGYIEATSGCFPVFKIHKERLEPMPVYTSVSDYQECERINKKASLNLHGKLTAISPVHSIAKSNPFFFIQLTCSERQISTSVVVQGSQFMNWVNFLHLEKEYILTDVCETTMNKGTKNERKILACTKSSRFLDYRPEYHSTAQKKRKLGEEILQSKVASSSAKRFKRENEHVLTDDTSDQEKSASRLMKTELYEPLTISYKGIITKSYPQLEMGTYELDNKVRLYTVHQPCPHHGRGLRDGAEVAINNVHLVKKAKSVVGLCCCTFSTLRISRFSLLASEWKPSVFPVSTLILHGQNLSLPDYIDLIQSSEKLSHMFSSIFRPSSLTGYSSSQQRMSSKSEVHRKVPKKESVITKLLNAAKASTSFCDKPRNIYGEFFDHPHSCNPTRHGSINLPSIYTIMEVRDMVMEKSKGVAWRSGTSDASGGSNEWLYQIIPSKDLLNESFVIGCLRASPTTGYLKLYDRTGNIPLLIAKPYRNGDSVNEDKSLMDYRGCIVKLKRFTAVIEQFRNSAYNNLSGSKKTRIYFQAKIDDLEILLKEKPNLSRATGHSVVEAEGKNKSPVEASQYNTSTNCQFKENNIKKSLIAMDNNNEPMEDNASTSHVSLIKIPDNTQVFMCKALFLVRHRENLMLKKKQRVFYACAVDIKVLAISSCEQVEQHLGHEQGLGSNSNSNDLSEFTVKCKSIALRLQHHSVSWYPFLLDGCFYILEESSSSKKSSSITKAMNYTSKALLDVTSSMDVKQVCRAQNIGEEEKGNVGKAMEEAKERFMCDEDDKIQTIQAILTLNKSEESDYTIKAREESSTKQVNFRGRILSRELRMSDITCQMLRGNNVLVPRFGPLHEATVQQLEVGFGYLGNKNVFLRLQDLESPNTIDVYMDLSRASYIDGLIPGAVITCRRFLSKLSRGGNIYCSFDACSSLTIDEPATEHLAPSVHRASRSNSRACSSESLIKQPQLSSVPQRLLIDFVKCETSGSRIHTISQVRCRVTAVQKVSLRWQCARCGHVIIREECSQGCANTGGFTFSAEARCLVEDGTAEAMLYLSQDTIPFLLKLSHDDMSRLKSHALNVGELVYQRYSYGNDRQGDASHLVSRYADANRILADHCCSSAVKRSINIYCKHSGSMMSKPEVGQTRKGYDTRPVMINQTEYSTLILPKLHLRAVDMEDINYQEEIQRLLAVHAKVLQTNTS
ncbi:CST complex subunit CTC1-like isoform X2 [Actinia tenebrosa]|uniref:CST complex subunit CTC1 n=1 Tax=Actinia tenebrosa TaxID=6105 RepID=A0A6P8IED2_ACTTE|nr:CST complex subunit CTC1-like isoform X2 [Actinia tenebrosa]